MTTSKLRQSEGAATSMALKPWSTGRSILVR